MFKKAITALCLAAMAWGGAEAQEKVDSLYREGVPLDSIMLSDPFILADKATHTYYMTGTGGLMWRSGDLKKWSGPWKVAYTDKSSWMTDNPMIWAAEVHERGGKYYYFATFTAPGKHITEPSGRKLDRRASQVLVADKAMGPYRMFGDSTFLPANQLTLDATLWEENGTPYMVYCHEWVQTNDGTIEAVKMKKDLSGTLPPSTLLFKASASPWSRENIKGKVVPNRVTDGPYLFKTGKGRLGMVWTSWVFHDYVQGVAYSETGSILGPWKQEKEPITPPNFGHGMLFQTFDGKWLMSIHSHRDVKGQYIRVPHLFNVDISGSKLKVGKEYKP